MVLNEQATTTLRSQRSTTPLIAQSGRRRLHISACSTCRRHASPRRYPRADVAGTARGPVKERVRDLIERVVAAQVGTGRGDAAMQTAICVSSLCSPGAYGPKPPPFITGISSGPSGGRNSYGMPTAPPQAAPQQHPGRAVEPARCHARSA